MRVEDGAECIRASMPGSNFWAVQGGTARITRSPGAIVSSSVVEDQSDRPVRGKPDGAQRPAEPDVRSVAAQACERRIDERGGQTWARR